MSTEIVAVQPMELISRELDKGTSIDQLHRLFDLQERFEKQQGAKKWAEAIRGFQAECPAIVKGNPVPDKQGNLKYKFASYEDIMTVIQPYLTKFEIVPTFTFTWKDKLLETTCHVRVGTHVEDTTVPLGIPDIPGANETQKGGGATAYGMRYSLKSALNIRVVGEDNDAAGLDGEETLTEQEIKVIEDMIEEISFLRGKGRPFPAAKFYNWLAVGATEASQVPRSRFAAGVAELNAKRNEAKA